MHLYHDAVRSRCRAVVTARAAADGNELLKFHSAPLACALDLNVASSLCCAGAGGAGGVAVTSATPSPCSVCKAHGTGVTLFI
jgi:hypothetical protein